MEYIPTSPRTTPTTEQLIKAGRSESSIFVTIGNTDCLWLNSNAHISVFLSIWREGSVVTARHIALWIANWIVNQHEIKYIVYCIINNCPSINAKWFNDELFKHEDCAEANSYFHSFIWLIVCLYNVKKQNSHHNFPEAKVASYECLLCPAGSPESKDSSFTFMYYKVKQIVNSHI